MNKDSIIFLVDASRAMFVENDAGEVPFHNSIRAAIAVITDKIISSDSDLVGLCLYRTRETKNSYGSDHIYELIELDYPDVSMISQLEKLLVADFESVYGHCEDQDFFFGSTLWTCSNIFSNCTIKVGHKRIFLFTNEDTPHEEGSALRDKTIQKAKDVSELGVDIELFPLNKKDEEFNVLKFYKHIITVDQDEITGEVHYDGANKFEELRSKVRRKEFKKRSLGKLALRLGEDLELAVRLYNIVQETKKDTPRRLDGSTNKPVKTITKKICQDTKSVLTDAQTNLLGFEIGGRLLKFDKDEAKSLKVIDRPGITVLGFKPRSALKDYHNLKYPSFIYPDEAAVAGSTVLFTSLLDRMIKLDKIAIVNIVARSNASCRFAALLPSEEKIDAEGIQVFPPGFHVITLPFCEDIRDVDVPKTSEVPENLVDKAKALVEKLRIRFDARNFENPVLQSHYSTLYALALDKTEEEIPEVVDLLVPDELGMSKFSDQFAEFKSEAFPDDYEPQFKSPKKRKRSDSLVDTPKKKNKAIDLDEWKKLVATGGIQKASVSELREYCSASGLRNYSKLKKKELVDMVTEHINKNSE